MSAERKTLKEYLEWAALKPRTTDWSALVTYDRDKCNQLLMQEYIEKHDSSQIMPPINEAYGTSESTWSWKLDYVTDAPRLSFENDPDTNTAELNMSMAIVGGKSLSLSDIIGYPQINRVSSYDPLDYPQLIANRTALKDVKGSVDNAGEVQLDLGDPIAQVYIWEETLDRIKHQRQMAGSFFKRKYREADPVKRRFSLGKLAHTEQEFMKPQSFKLRTIMESGAGVMGAANYGNGAVEIRIAMDNSAEGGAPGEDWLYPLPSDRPDLNASMILGTEFFMLSLIGMGTARVFNAPHATFQITRNSEGFVQELEVEKTGGELLIEPFSYEDMFFFNGFYVPIWLSQDDKLTMTLYSPENGPLIIRTGMGGKNHLRPVTCRFDGKDYNLQVGLGVNATYKFELDESSRRLKISLLATDKVEFAFTAPEETPIVLHAWLMLASTGEFWGATIVEQYLKAINKELEMIDVFVLNTLLFNAEDAVQLKTADLTGEMVMFGSISPRLTTFSISPLEVMVGYDQTHPFKIDQPVSGPTTWRVEGLDGSTKGVGSIDGNGLYTAPALSDIPGTYKRVKVSATNNEHTSKALVTVVARTITLNPLIEVCNASNPGQPPETREFSAHTMNGTLKWSVIGDGTIPPTAGTDGKNTYSAPLKKEQAYFSFDEILVENTTTGQQQKSLVVLKHQVSAMAIQEDFEGMPAGQAKLKVKIGFQEPDPSLVTWECIPADAGTVDSATGVFTASVNTSSQFVLIKGSANVGIMFEGTIILPLPLAPLPLKPPPETPQTPNQDKINELLEAVRKEFDSFKSIAGVSDELEGNLQRITELAGGINNGQ